MSKQSPPRTDRPRSSALPPEKARRPLVLNRNLNRQTRKVLGKHYRAKYGVK